MTKSEAIVAVLERSRAPMSIREIVEALHDAGRKSENYNGVSVYLQNLLIEGSVRRPERGRYVASERP
jgi:predicted Zn-ribbon and HTH transcriptional regulator